MTTRHIEVAAIAGASLLAAGLTAYGGQGLLVLDARSGEANPLDAAVFYVPILFVVSLILTVGAFSVTDGFADHDGEAVRRARSATAWISVAATFVASAYDSTFFLPIAASGAGAVAALSIFAGKRRSRHR